MWRKSCAESGQGQMKNLVVEIYQSSMRASDCGSLVQYVQQCQCSSAVPLIYESTSYLVRVLYLLCVDTWTLDTWEPRGATYQTNIPQYTQREHFRFIVMCTQKSSSIYSREMLWHGGVIYQYQYSIISRHLTISSCFGSYRTQYIHRYYTETL